MMAKSADPSRKVVMASCSNAVYTTSELRDMMVPLLPKHDMASACLFGSYARGEADEASDIDVLLGGNQGFRPLGIFGVAEELHRLSGSSGKRPDQVSELDPGPFRDSVLREAVTL